MAAASQNETRQPYAPIIHENSSVEVAAPTAAPAMISACTQPCAADGIQFEDSRPQDGYSGAVSAPMRNRTIRKDGTIPNNVPSPGFPPTAVRPVSSAVPSPVTVRTARGPKRSVIQPPGVIRSV